MFRTLLWLASVAGALMSETPARAECAGTLSGAVRASFKCNVELRYRENKRVTYLAITVRELPAGLKALMPAGGMIKGKPQKKSYDEKSIEEASTSVVTTDGKNFLGKTVKVTFTSVEPEGKRGFKVTGTVSGTARNLDGKGEVKVQVKF